MFYVLCLLSNVNHCLYEQASHDRYNAIIYIDTIEFQPFCYNATNLTGILLINEYKKKPCSGKG